MSVDLGSPAIEVAIALAFVFFLLSLIVSAGTEAISWLFKQRAKTLVKGFERLLGDENATTAMLNHPLVKSDVTTAADKRRPSYVSARNFALALVQVLRKEGKEVTGAIQQVEAGVKAFGESSPFGEQLQALVEEADSSVVRFRAAAERWFDDGMDRVSGWYKRWSQLIAIGVALVVAVGLNADAVRITERLATDPIARSTAAAQGTAFVDQAAAAGKNKDAKALTPTPAATKETVDKLKELNLPILWSEANDNVTLNTVFGWLITVFAISLGAPFWFDSLSKLAHLRTTGKKPATEG